MFSGDELFPGSASRASAALLDVVTNSDSQAVAQAKVERGNVFIEWLCGVLGRLRVEHLCVFMHVY